MEGKYAVITGDVVSSMEVGDWAGLQAALASMLAETRQVFQDNLLQQPEEVFQGDAVQVALRAPEKALRVALFMRSTLHVQGGQRFSGQLDMRVAVGLGGISELRERLGRSMGEAFVLSGRILAGMKKQERLRVASPNAHWNKVLQMACALLDELSAGWTAKQHEAVALALSGLVQEDIGQRMGVKQATVNAHLRRAGMKGINACLDYFEAAAGEEAVWKP